MLRGNQKNNLKKWASFSQIGRRSRKIAERKPKKFENFRKLSKRVLKFKKRAYHLRSGTVCFRNHRRLQCGRKEREEALVGNQSSFPGRIQKEHLRGSSSIFNESPRIPENLRESLVDSNDTWLPLQPKEYGLHPLFSSQEAGSWQDWY